ncbi:TetR/AcrR family transcriptional regulator [Cryobacterium sp. SO2]|uniref:TetR/AcrR family transcriptional regulator n=1 Tax=Cryobacterium sp. SO2 TaxID=1897060 RepID=UPI00223D9D21|nr:TetR/AcrR family transcriptional regulator [Cryobacterium sp. SO2]WEO76453.1 TetR/AcrR family transcriptional regulator [Cryobacterium sp. SO2]
MSRPRTFDEDTLLDAAVELFWVHGYKGASLTHLSAETGVTNGSLYQAYGSKWALFLAAYRRYCATRVAVVVGAFTEERDGIERTVNAYFDAIVDDCLAHPDRRGCLMLNTISELGTDADITRISAGTVDAMEAAVAGALVRVTPPAADPAMITASAAHVVALSQALIQLSRMGRAPEDLRRIGGQAAASTQRLLQIA